MLPNPNIREVNLLDYIKLLQKRWKLIFIIMLVIPLSVTLYVFKATPIYRATTSILIERIPPKVTKFEQVSPVKLEDQAYYQTQYKILSARFLAEKVFKDLSLDKEPYFKNPVNLTWKFRKEIKIEPIRTSQLVFLHVDDPEAERAALIANSYAREYVNQDIESRNRASKEALSWLESQMSDIKKKMQDAEEALNSYLQENKIIVIQDVEKTEKRTESLLDSLKLERARVSNALAEGSRRYGKKHPKMIALTIQLDDFDKKIEEETENILKLSDKMVKYNLLKKEAESSKEVYASILERTKETAVSEKIEASGIRVIDPATVPTKPYSPKKSASILISVILALPLGIALVFIREYIESSVHTAEEVRTYLGLPFLGYIPSLPKKAGSGIQKALICYNDPVSIVAENYRSVRSSLLFAAPDDKPLKTILVTSARAGEGKTFLCSNLATVFSQINERVLLLDMDIRKPMVYKIFNFKESDAGLSDYLAVNASLKDITRPTDIKNLSVITAGKFTPSPADLLASAKIDKFFDELKSNFDRVIIDSPPILDIVDTLLILKHVDGVVWVIRGAATHLFALEKTRERILEAKGKIVGAIINDVVVEKADKYYS